MGERGSRKIPVTEREFLWVQDDDKGEVVLHVGPTMVSPTAADRIVVHDGLGGFREDTTGRTQRMIEVNDNQYAVLENPLAESDEGPNGRFKPGRNESRPLKNGTRKMIPGPCSFWLRPGQRCEVRDAHELGSNQYLVVKVYGEVDANAPYYRMTAQSAQIRTTTDETDDTNLEQNKEEELTRGQLIVIRGLDTQFYIPPTGVDILPDTSLDDSGVALSSDAARAVMTQLDTAQAYAESDEEVFMAEKEAFDKHARPRRGRAAKKQSKAPPPVQAQQAVSGVISNVSPEIANLAANIENIPALRDAVEREARKARLVRDAVVLGEKEYCVVIDADGKRQIKVGPARVFPGPYDKFETFGSRNRVYDAYELLPQRALWVRFIARMANADLAKKLPRNVELEHESYEPGDELLITGVNTFFFPFNEIEILSPETGQPVFGNDHSNVFIEAIGIDQKSGIYVSDLATGEVRLVRGKRSYLVDPRKEIHIPRRVPPEDWNRWIAYGEPHKRQSKSINTFWALSVVVPPNTACLATSANSQRVIEGPCVTLLEFEERLVPLRLSTGVPKSENTPLTTCFLRVVGNRVTDTIAVETADFVQVDVRVSYSVTFQREKKKLWFGTENYVQVLCEHIRSLVRNTCRVSTLIELWPKLPTIIRDTVLGQKGEDGVRPGRPFEEYGFVVTEVEVLTSEIKDRHIGDLMRQMQNASVALQINDRKASEEFDSAKKRADLDVRHHDLKVNAEKRKAEFQALVHHLEQEVRSGALKGQEELEKLRIELEAQRLMTATESRIEREAIELDSKLKQLRQETEAKVAANRMSHTELVEHKASLTELEVSVLQAQSSATVAERQAVQQGLIEAMTALGDKVMLSEAAKNMNLVSLFQGKDVGTILREVLGGTRVIDTIDKMRNSHGPEA